MKNLRKIIALYIFSFALSTAQIYSMPLENDRDDIPFLALPETVHQAKDRKELKDVKESQDVKRLKDSKENKDIVSQIYTEEKNFLLKTKKDGTASVFKIKSDGTEQAIPLLRIGKENMDFPDMIFYTFTQPIITKTYSVTFAPHDNIIAVVSGKIDKLTLYLGELSYLDETYFIQLYRIDPKTKKTVLIQEANIPYEGSWHQNSIQLTFLPNSKGLYIWYPESLEIVNRLTFFDFNAHAKQPLSGTNFIYRLGSDIESNALVFSPDNRFAAIIDKSEAPIEKLAIFKCTNNGSIAITSKTMQYEGKNWTTEYYEPMQTISYNPGQLIKSLAYSKDGRFIVVALVQEAKAGSEGAQAFVKNNKSMGKIIVYKVEDRSKKFTSLYSTDLNFKPIAVAFDPGANCIIAGNTESDGIIKRYSIINNALRELTSQTLPEQNITSLTLSPYKERITITTKQGLIKILDLASLRPTIDIFSKKTFNAVKPFDILSPVSYNFQENLAAVVINGSVSVYTVNILGQFTLLTNDLLAEYGHKKIFVFGPETEVLSIPNDMGGFSIVPRNKENEKIAAEFQAKKATAINHIIAQWEKELDDLAVEDKIEILKKWAKIAREKQWNATAKDSAERFKRQLREAREAFEREAAIADDEINEAEIERELDDLEKIKL
jgi:WD40 repeat protein